MLTGVSCASVTMCMAVGYTIDTAFRTLTELWDGSGWSVVTSLDQGPIDNLLNGVSCASTTHCVAVGYYDNASHLSQTLAESWDGTSWSVEATVNPGGNYAVFSSISCPTTGACVAAGYSANGSTESTLVEDRVGSTWAVVTTASPGAVENYLAQVTCSTTTHCIAVGYSADVLGSGRTLVESGQATGSWSAVPSSDPAGFDLRLSGVSWTGPTTCAAVGTMQGATLQQTLVESPTGSMWSVVPSPTPAGGGELDSVSCTGPTACTAVGDYGNAVGLRLDARRVLGRGHLDGGAQSQREHARPTRHGHGRHALRRRLLARGLGR